ncbi:cryptochrome/photolyase family protein [Dermatophilus congolensis]|uniref:cryptochrome/photolyase family protein n=1 Tax=Dermatophilus congolensis TaxID=1863 RepID=UPI001AAEE8CE|nr:deoxyribodipyrimidine photo-lyase [Dermatophilus congolensis]MBO3142250.1 deoxyribodipyrimidine photo-lyase [Dermatophilus congolensis]MBO3151241.1 deoxyribodipyrimidine photo-lyase [Dermatophilus congolensis]MBO3161755.1 deoxyribodipyrimidine photo-lyase [Dermatophilus congolensis]MBO3162527.1 deoxyribodipyrimidine photo-lyase [Dermatophilus congolensis]MBO3176080.1 deoxyribodipyrimidine photo-lyase [Dermatophilus congolensis]
MAVSVLWLRRDLRIEDLPALGAAAEATDGGVVVPLFVLEPHLFKGCGAARLAALREALVSAQESYEGRLCVRVGDAAQVVPEVVREAGAISVHVSGESTPYGRVRGKRVLEALGEVPMVATGTPYAVSPGRVRKKDGTPYKVFSSFHSAWLDCGWDRPFPVPRGLDLGHRLESDEYEGLLGDGDGPEGVAHPDGWSQRWQGFLQEGIAEYGDERDRPGVDGTSGMSEPLKFGLVHPRTLLADVADYAAAGSEGARIFVKELAWREFYADVLWHNPDSAWHDLGDGLAGMEYADPQKDAVTAELFDAWKEGVTGYPIVDAGMRQLRATGWMHNRVRMITASFLTKDLHVWWPYGARFFLEHLRDGDVASNNHSWQWVAGTGTDAAPYFRVFNPVRQGEKFDPDGSYVRQWVPELAHVSGGAVHVPWKAPDGYACGYPLPVVDHAQERAEALRRYEAARR